MKYCRYIEIIYGDNDFGLPITMALTRLWQYIYDNNNHCLSDFRSEYFGQKPLARIFYMLNKHGVLSSLITRMFVLAYLECSVEHATRGLYLARPDWKEAVIKNPEIINFKNDFLNISIMFHQDDKFSKIWRNGEHAILDIETGKVNTF